jgi:gliding motility-associated-like protein
MKVFLLFFVISISLQAQDTITYKSHPTCVKDAYIESRLHGNNFGNHIDLPAIAWTNGGVPTDARGLIHFDISNIPIGAEILNARLSLFSYNSPANGSHSTLSGSNESILKRITSNWVESQVTWDNQPTTSSQNSVILPASTNSIQNYPNINVTDMVQDMVNNPSGSFGFQLSVIAEQQYFRRLVFASTDNPDTTLFPTLEIEFVVPNTATNQVINCYTPMDFYDISLELPNVITPNGDNSNDLFTPNMIKGIASLSTTILNRWGNKVFVTNNLLIEWNGKAQSGQDVTDGVYFWVIEYTDISGKENSKSGIVTVVR